MARDYKSRAAQKPQRKPISAWVWLSLGIIIGAVSVGFACLKYSPAPRQQGWVGSRPPLSATEPVRSAEKKPLKTTLKPPRFDFYNILQDQEVLVPEEELQTAPKAVQKSPKPRPESQSSGRRYLVQVSSFRSHRDAETLKARLGLLGLRARVSKASIKGSTWYRVQLGPYASKSAMQDVRKQLASSGYRSLAIALK